MRWFILFLVLCLPPPVYSEVRAFNLELKRLPYMRDSFYPDNHYWDYGLNLNWTVGAKGFFWENDIGTKTRNDRFRDIYWAYKAGYQITPGVAILWDHKSRHAMDEYRKEFEVRDMYGFRFDFLK